MNGFPVLGHDAAAALIVDHRLVAAVEEERLNRRKRSIGLPPLRAMREVLDLAGLTGREIDVVAYPWLPSAMGTPTHDMERHVLFWLRQAGLSVRPGLPVRFVEHHLSHGWCGTAFVPGGVSGRRVGVLVLDGSGECTSGASYIFDGDLRPEWNLAQSSSLGIYYEAVSAYLGFAWGEEGKTMGLAAYGRELGLPVPPLVDDRFGGRIPRHGAGPSPREIHEEVRWRLVDMFRALHGDHLSFNARADVARAAQQLVSDRILRYVKELIDRVDVLVLSGGVALNCSINAQVAAVCATRGIELVVPPPASDTGVAIGAAVGACDDPARVHPMGDPFLGRGFAPDEIGRAFRAYDVDVRPSCPEDLADELLERSCVCGWFEGRCEAGPRALGKRSILARPDSPAVRDRVNLLKGRESWRPLAPSLTPAEFDRSFPGSSPSPHMLVAASVAPEAACRLAGVVHVDDTSRPQVVVSDGPYRRLLEKTGRVSGTEALVCTSFNRAGEPLVYSPGDALASARAMGLDLIAGDGWAARLKES